MAGGSHLEHLPRAAGTRYTTRFACRPSSRSSEAGRRPSRRASTWLTRANPPAATLVLAHGAGAPQTHPFMVDAASSLAERALAVLTFNFPYMDARRRVPDRTAVLERAWLDVLAHVAGRGGPAASVCHRRQVDGRPHGVARGHRPAPRRRRPRGASGRSGLPRIPAASAEPAGTAAGRAPAGPRSVPALFVQGTRDAFGTPQELEPVLAIARRAGHAPRDRAGRPLVRRATRFRALEARRARRGVGRGGGLGAGAPATGGHPSAGRLAMPGGTWARPSRAT